MSSLLRENNLLSLPGVASVAPVAIALSLYGLYKLSQFGSRPKNYPPGPPTLPIIGNLHVFPRKHLHLAFSELAKKYGDVFSLQVLNHTIIVLNTPTAVKELIDKRARTSSNRPKSLIADMITPNDMNFGTCHHTNETWRVLRRAAQHALSGDYMKKWSHVQHAEATQVMFDFIHDPQGWCNAVGRFTASFLLAYVYGRRSPRYSSLDVQEFQRVHPQFLTVLEIGRLPPVDVIPALAWVPERWSGWKKIVRSCREMHEALFDRLLTAVETRMKEGHGNGCFIEEAIQRADEWGLTTREHIMNLGGTLLQGSDTASASLQNAVLALVAFPEAQRKAQEEIDRVIGHERVPEWDDLSKLPYCMALIEEASRFRPSGPIGLPHEMLEDEVIDGVLYPKGATVFLNTFGMFHDERFFDRPYEFIPERFLKHPLGIKEGVEDDPARRPNLIFGGGRRVCPGIALAKTSMELNIVNWLWGFDFLPPLDADGKEIPPVLENHYANITAAPIPFDCRIVPRSQGHVDVIRRQYARAAEHLAPYEAELTPEDRAYNAMYRDTL